MLKVMFSKHKFKNFGHNRNWSLKKCRVLFEDFNYILLLDADMVVKFGESFIKNKNKLSEYDYYYFLQGNDNFKYRNIRLINLNNSIEYVGATHEYLNIPANFKNKTFDIEDVFINDVGDGSNKDDKYERDIRILEEDILENPENVRSYFYLANSYYDTGHYNKAIIHYKTRIAKGGWFEEVFYSMYRIGCCYFNLKKYEKGLLKFMNAYQINPSRAEPLYEMIRYYRIHKHPELANIFFKHTIDMEHPNKEALFVNSDIYDYKLLYEFYIFYYYLNINDKLKYDEKDIHLAFFKLLEKRYHTKNVLENYKFYCKNIEYDINSNKLVLKRYDISSIKDFFYNSSNCTLIEKNNKIYFIVRHVNYYFNNDWDYVYREKEKSKNYLVTYKCKSNENDENNENDEIIESFKEKELDEEIKENKREIKNYDVLEGLQDIRLFKFKNTIYYTGNVVFNYKDSDNTLKRGSNIEFGTYDIENNKITGEIIRPFKKRMCEKNWALFNDNKKIYCIHSWYPINIGFIRKDKFISKILIEAPTFFKQIRGSTHGIIINNSILFMCHFVCYSKPRQYYHIFVKINKKTFKYENHSYPFTFENQPIEYCCGMIYYNNLLHITYSIKDITTKLLTMKYNDIVFIN